MSDQLSQIAIEGPPSDLTSTAPGRRRRRLRISRQLLMRLAGMLLVLLALLAFAQYGLQHLGVKEYVVPKPTDVFSSLWENWGTVLGPALWVTGREVVLGLLLGIVVGVISAVQLDAVPAAEPILVPFVIALLMTPMIALVPILFLEFGDSILIRVVIVALASSPMMMLNTINGLRRTPAVRLELMKAMRANSLQTLTKVKFPGALPNMFTGLLISAIFAVIAAVGTEFVGGSDGLGGAIVYYSSILQTDIVFAAIFLLATMGVTLYAIISLLQHRFAGWQE